MKSGTLKTAQKLFHRRRFTQVISLLEPQVFLFRENPRFYYLLGISCLYADDVGGANSYLKRAQQLDPDNAKIAQALAAVSLKRRDTDESLRLWLSILDRDPRNRTARKALALIKRNIEPGLLVEAIETGKVKALYPKPPFRLPGWVITTAVLLFALIPAGLLLEPVVRARINPSVPARHGVEVLNIGSDVKDLTAFDQKSRYILTPQEIRQTLARIQNYFDRYRDNMAMMETNRILQSNASPAVKQKAELLRDYLRKPDFVTFSDNFSYQEVAQHPYLYGSCYIRWKGKVSNLDIGAKSITFDFLVGYQTEKVVEGIVPVTMDFAADIRNSEALEIIAQVINHNGTVVLKATSIRQILPGAN